MRYGSVCSGIEAATAAWHPLGWMPVWFSEIEPFPCKVLKYHYPNVPNLGDMTKLNEKEIYINEPIDLLVGGTPCQSFSIAGLRGGLADSRGNLALEYCRILASKQPKWFVWENVPGVLSSERGADLRSIFQGFQACGYSFAWRVLNAEYFGVPQRRNRIFVVGHLGDDWRPPAAVLFEPQGLRRHFKKGRKAGEEVTCPLGASTKGRLPGIDEAVAGQIIARPLNANAYRNDAMNENFITHVLAGNGQDASEDGTGRSLPLVAGTIDASCGRLQGCSGQDACHGHSTLVFEPASLLNENWRQSDIKNALRSGESKSSHAVLYTLHGSDGTISTATEAQTACALKSRIPGGIENSSTSIVQNESMVRRLTPSWGGTKRNV